MSGFAAILNFDGRPVEKPLIARMLDAIAHRGSGGSGVWCDGPIALGHRMFHTTPESLRETQPLGDETGSCHLILDGRIDNVADLRSALESSGFGPRTDTDAELVLRSYQCWGREFVHRVIGDFALVIWDARTRTLLCARDALGVRPFYYYADGRTFICGSEIRELLENPQIWIRPNEGVIGEYLSNRTPTCEETLYQSIMRLPPGHILVAADGRLTKLRYFDLDFGETIRLRNDEEYAERFRELFEEAVRCRLRSVGPVAAQLSGGLDSSSIVCTARTLLRGETARCQDFEAYALTFPGLSCDETEYINAVVGHTGIRANLLTPTPPGEIDYAEEVGEYGDFPEYPNTASMLGMRRLAGGRGCRVMLTGQGGDEWLSGSPAYNADLLRSGRLFALGRQIQIAAAQSSVRMGKRVSASRMLISTAILPLLPGAMQRMAHRIAGHRQSFPNWIDPDFAKRISLEERLNPRPAMGTSGNLARRDFYEYFHDGELAVTMDRFEHWFSRSGLELRHPFLDRRIVEFAWAIPEDQCQRFGFERLILRNAMQGILPEAVRTRISKGDFSQPFLESVKFNSRKIAWDNLDIVRCGWVNQSKLKAALNDLMASYDKGIMQYGVPVWTAIGTEIWHHVVFGRTSGSSRARL